MNQVESPVIECRKNRVYFILTQKKVKFTIDLLIFNKLTRKETSYKLLGIYLEVHARIVHGKISSVIGLMLKIKDLLLLSALKSIYYSLVYPHIFYDIIFSSASSAVELQKLFI